MSFETAKTVLRLDDATTLSQMLLRDSSILTLNHVPLLHYACRWGASRCAEELLQKHGCDIDDVNEEGATALHWACSNGSFKCVRMLLHYKADINIEATSFGYGSVRNTPLLYALKNGHRTCAALLLAAGATFDQVPFMMLTQPKHRGCVELMIDAGAAVPSFFQEHEFAVKFRQKRNNCKLAFLAVYGVLRKRRVLPSHEHPDGHRAPLDMVRTISSLIWDSRFDLIWTTLVAKRVK